VTRGGHTDTDMGLNNILKEIDKLKNCSVKVGVTQDKGAAMTEDGVTVATYAAYNEFGVRKHGKQVIPSRPFIRGWIDSKREQLAKRIEKLYGQVSDGKMFAEIAIRELGQFGESGIKSFIRNGPFEPNADSTVRAKGSSRPLIDTGTLRNSIRYEIVELPVDQAPET
jgi:hypothetical protein